MEIKKRTVRNVIIVVVLVVLLVVGGVYANKERIRRNREIAVIAYKTAVVKSLECQYSCPVEEVHIQNQTEHAPVQACVRQCTQYVKALNVTKTTYSAQDLEGDSLFKDIDAIILTCKNQNTNVTDGNVDTRPYYDCVSHDLKGLSVNYPYLLR